MVSPNGKRIATDPSIAAATVAEGISFKRISSPINGGQNLLWGTFGLKVAKYDVGPIHMEKFISAVPCFNNLSPAFSPLIVRHNSLELAVRLFRHSGGTILTVKVVPEQDPILNWSY